MAEPQWQTEEVWTSPENPLDWPPLPGWSLSGSDQTMRIGSPEGPPLTDEVFRAHGWRKKRRLFKATEWEDVTDA